MAADIDKALNAATARATEAHAEDTLAKNGIIFEDSRDFISAEPHPFDWIITDLVAKGMKGDLNAKSKQWKSFFGIQLALSVATGKPFLGMSIPRPRRVMYFNLELLERGFWERLHAMETALELTPKCDALTICNLRGNAEKLRGLEAGLVAEASRRGIDLIVIDPRYKIVASGEDENSAVGLRGVLDFRDALAEVAAVLMIGHDPKGEVAGKGMADRGAGSYTAGADYDFSFALSPHVEAGYSVLSTSCRYRKSPQDMTIRFDEERQIFDAEPDKPAIVKDSRRADGSRARSPDEKAERARLRLQGLETAVREYIAENGLTSKTAFMQAIAALPAGAAFPSSGAGVCLRDAIKTLAERGVVSTTPKMERKLSGRIGRVKNGGDLIGSPAAVAEYLKTFQELPL